MTDLLYLVAIALISLGGALITYGALLRGHDRREAGRDQIAR